MASLGKLHEFKPDEEEFATYLERVEIFFAANGVEDTKKVYTGIFKCHWGSSIRYFTQPGSSFQPYVPFFQGAN